ncbi:UNVERIFIED_CONTAM: hypothetical protein FKN15_064004 [Acipenser sinensis]
MSSSANSWDMAVQAWYDEVKDFKYGVGSTNGAVVGHYTQVVWYRSNKVGCAVAHCPGSKYEYFYVCQYCPPGNNQNSLTTPYKAGPSCGDCPNACDNKLCTVNHFASILTSACERQRRNLSCKSTYPTRKDAKWTAKSDCTQYQCQNGAVLTDVKYLLDCPQTDCKDKKNDMEGTKLNDQSYQPSTFKSNESDSKENCLNRSQTCETSESSECLPQEEQGAKAQRTAKNTSPKVRKTPNRILVPIDKGEKKQKSSTKNLSPNREMSEQSLSPNQTTHSEQIRKLEQDVKKLKSDLLTSKQCEQELRSHFCNLTNSERSLRPEISLLRQANDLLQTSIIACIIKTKQRDKQATVLLEKKVRAEMEARAIIEKQLSDLRTRKIDETSAITQGALLFTNRQEHTESLKKKAKELETDWKQLQQEFQAKESQKINLENEVEVLCKYKGIEQDSEMLLSALSTMQDKTQHLEYNLSAETRIKLDLFSALGDARRQLEIAQGKIMKQDKEIGEMKQKIAEVMAVMPGITYGVQHPVTPQYLTKFVNSEHYVLDPSALMYKCLKK